MCKADERSQPSGRAAGLLLRHPRFFRASAAGCRHRRSWYAPLQPPPSKQPAALQHTHTKHERKASRLRCPLRSGPAPLALLAASPSACCVCSAAQACAVETPLRQYFTVPHYTILYTILFYSALYYTILYYTILCDVIHHSIRGDPPSPIQYYPALCCSTLYCTLLYTIRGDHQP